MSIQRGTADPPSRSGERAVARPLSLDTFLSMSLSCLPSIDQRDSCVSAFPWPRAGPTMDLKVNTKHFFVVEGEFDEQKSSEHNRAHIRIQ